MKMVSENKPLLYVTLKFLFSEKNADLVKKQRLVAIISEMIHTASLIHDDILGNYYIFLLYKLLGTAIYNIFICNM